MNFFQRLSGLCLSTTLQFGLPTSQKTFLHLKKYKNTLPKNLKGLKNKSYKERLAILNIPSLKYRRAYNDLVYLYKIIHGLCDSRLSSLFPHSDLSSHSTLRRHCFQLSLPKPRTDLIKYSFCYRSTKLWNSLPTHIANSPSISHFKPLIYRLDIFVICIKILNAY